MSEDSKMLSSGPVTWITGLSGSGKTTIAEHLLARLKRDGTTAVLLDGDRLCAVLGVDFGHQSQDRRSLAYVYARLCREISWQGVAVICGTISMFNDVRDWNREHIPGYLEVYLDVPLAVRVERDPKGLYESYEGSGLMVEDGGEYELRANPDITIPNYGTLTQEEAVQDILDSLSARGRYPVRSHGEARANSDEVAMFLDL